jgi:hypothetical protein
MASITYPQGETASRRKPSDQSLFLLFSSARNEDRVIRCGRLFLRVCGFVFFFYLVMNHSLISIEGNIEKKNFLGELVLNYGTECQPDGHSPMTR